ncbi:MAG: response regulator, partial [Bacteroidota bacterium]
MKFNCIIVDDEKLARELLLEFLEPYPEIEVLAECSKGTEAVDKIEELKPDLIFLDVQMPGMDGFEVLEALEHKPYVIFTTAYDQYAIKAFDNNALDYLLKPLDEDRFKRAVERASGRVKSNDTNFDELIESLKEVEGDGKKYSTHLFVQKSEKLLNIDVNDILHLEASGDYTILTTKTDQFL